MYREGGSAIRTSLGHYTNLRKIGSGGMGEVYAAEDPKLHRQVAIKVLPEDMASQPERVERFEREAQAVAALDHPNIVTIHSVEEADGVHFITMQLVEGETLSEKIPRKGFSLEKFFHLAIPIAEALSAAHEHGITHRDLKPQNIMVTNDGRVKVLDFGLAKLRERDVTPDGATVASGEPLTGEGKIVGTVAYMSPEQAEGKEVDHRTDIFSLGIVLYEMATGERPFKGDTSVSLVSSIVKDTPPPVTELNDAMPRHLGRIVRYCLGKDPGHRYQSAVDVRNELSELKKEVDSGEMTVPLRARTGRRWVWPAAVGVLAVALALTFLLPGDTFGGEDSGPLVAQRTPLTDMPGIQSYPSLSPDGRNVLFLAPPERETPPDIFLQRVGGEPRNLTEDHEGSDVYPAFDPTGDRIAFVSEREGGGIYVMGATGESPRLVIDEGTTPSWSPDGEKLVYSTGIFYLGDPYNRLDPHGELRIVDVDTSESTPLFYGKPEFDALEPTWSPNDKRIAFWAVIGGQRDIWTIPVTGGEERAVTEDVHTDWGPFWSRDGQHLYFLSDRGGKPELWRVAIDEDSGETQGVPETVWAPDVGRVMGASMSQDGQSIACTLELITSEIARADFDPQSGQLAGDWQPIHSSKNQDLANMALSPDDAWLAVTSRRGLEDVFVMRTDGTGLRNLTNDLEKDRYPVWYPVLDRDGGAWLTFSSNRNGPEYHVWAVRPNGTGLRQLTQEGTNTLNARWWPGGTRLSTSTNERVIFEFPDGITGEAFGPGRGNLFVSANASWSPDARLLAQTSNMDGPGDLLRVTSTEDRSVNQVVRDPDGNPYPVEFQRGRRWLDDHRLIFWDELLMNAFLWDTETEEARIIEDADKDMGTANVFEFVFSADGQTLFRQITTIDTDIYLLELSR